PSRCGLGAATTIVQSPGGVNRAGGADPLNRARRRSTLSLMTHAGGTADMALDPQAQAFLELVAKSGRPAYHTLSPKDARQLFRETRPASTPAPPAIGSVRDLTADGPHGPIPLRVYRPAGVPASTPLPVLVFFHGGGWVIGDLETHDVLARQL